MKENENTIVELGADGGGELGKETQAGGNGKAEIVKEYNVNIGEPVQIAEMAEQIEACEAEDFGRDGQS